MSWTLVKDAFFVINKDGKCEWIDIAVCANCSSIHIPPEEANGCGGCDIPKIDELKEVYKAKYLEHRGREFNLKK